MAFAVLLLSATAFAQAPGMPTSGTPGQAASVPDARMMSGIPMPIADVPDRTVSVRVVRGELTNVVPNQTVELSVGGKSQTATTDSAGRAQFSDVATGTPLKVTSTVSGERLESETFSLPDKGGVRLLLVASGKAGGPAQMDAPAVAGTVSFSADSRIAIEFDEDALSVFYVLSVANASAVPVNPKTPVVFDLPADAMNATLMEGSSTQAQIKGRRVTVSGPFKPGQTMVNVAYQLTSDGGTRIVEQQFPVAFQSLTLGVQKVGPLQVSSPQIRQQQVAPIEGKPYIMAAGPALPAGRALTIELSGLPHHETWPRTVALVLGVGVLVAGAWAAMGRPPAGREGDRRALEAERDRLFARLLQVEEARRAGEVDERAYSERRAAVMADLERVYGELDVAVPPPAEAGSDRGMMA